MIVDNALYRNGERVDLGTETYFWSASDHILSAVQQWRGTAIWPGR